MSRQVFNRTEAKTTGINSLPIAYQFDDRYNAGWIFFAPGLWYNADGSIINGQCGLRVYRGVSGTRGWLQNYAGGGGGGVDLIPYWLQKGDAENQIPVVDDKLQYVFEIYAPPGFAVNNATFEFLLIPFSDH